MPDLRLPLRRLIQRTPYPTILEQAWQAHLARRAPDAPTVISTFAGTGGSSLGYSMAGYRELLAVEWDDHAAQCFRTNFPEVPLYHGDIGQLSVDEVLNLTHLQPGELTVFDGSPPCQGFSTAGKRLMDDPRNQLFRHYIRLLEGLKPHAMIMENVSGMVKGKMKLIFVEILKTLKSCGYRVSARLLNAKYFHVPQSRERMIFVGIRDDLDLAPSHPAAQSHPLACGPAIRDVITDEAERQMLLEAGRKYAAYREWRWIKPGGKKTDLGGTAGFTCQKYDPSRPAPTITKNDGNISMHGALHWAEPRRFSVAEFKRLASFPDPFIFPGDWGQAVARIGNCVPPCSCGRSRPTSAPSWGCNHGQTHEAQSSGPHPPHPGPRHGRHPKGRLPLRRHL